MKAKEEEAEKWKELPSRLRYLNQNPGTASNIKPLLTNTKGDIPKYAVCTRNAVENLHLKEKRSLKAKQ